MSIKNRFIYLVVSLVALCASCAVEVQDEVHATGEALSYVTTWPGIGSSAFNRDALQCIASAIHADPVTCTMTAGTVYDRQIDCQNSWPIPLALSHSRLVGATSNPHNANGYYRSSTMYLNNGLYQASTEFYWTQAPRYVAVTNHTILHSFAYPGIGQCNITRNEANGQITGNFSGTF